MPQTSSALVVLQFAFATLLPVVAAAGITILEHRTKLGRMSYPARQALYGLIFGAIAIFGTEMGIVTKGATMNVRDAAPLVAGLYFGGSAGIIAGIIGGVERWFAVMWGRGMFTRVACSVATIAVGFYAAALRKYLFGNRKPSWSIAFAIGLVAEVLHLLLVFVTNLDNSLKAFEVVQVCTAPMVFCNALSVALAGVAVALASGKGLKATSTAPDISQKVQRGMLAVVIAGFFATTGFVFVLETSLSTTEAADTLENALSDTERDIIDASDEHLLTLAQVAKKSIPSVSAAKQDVIDELMESLDLVELHIIDQNGIIVASSGEEFIGFDMASGEQAAEFLVLLPGGSATTVVQEYQPMTMDSNVWRKYAGISIEGGFLQVAYDAARFAGDLAQNIRPAVANRHVGHEGLFAVLTRRNELIGTRSDIQMDAKDAQTLSNAMERAQEGEVFEVTFQDVSYQAMYRRAEGMRVLAMLPTSEAITARDLSVLVTSFMEVLVFAALFAAIYVLIERVVVRSIWQVNGRLGQISRGDLNVEVDVRDSSEFASLSNDINNTVAALRDAIAAESRRIERDLATAKAIQESALPRTFPPFPDIAAFDIFASMNAAREVGGDFYDFFLVDDHTLGFLIADVSGKGIPASLFMMAAKSELANYIKSGMRLSDAVHNANWNLCQGNDAGMFVTVWAATLDYHTGNLTYVNAGHNFPLLRHDGEWTWLKKKCGLFLGTFETAKYRQETITLAPGDEILLYTDGVNEAFSIDEEEYGNERLEAFLATHANLSPHMLIDALRVDVRKWATDAEQSDDITMLALEYGVPPEVSETFVLEANQEGLEELKRRMDFELSQFSCPEKVQLQLQLVLEELFVNICKHGYKGKEEPGKVEFAYVYDVDDCALTMSLTDWGVPFDPTSYHIDRTEQDVDKLKGLGIVLATGYVDDIAYVRDRDRNVIAFRKSW